MVLEGRPFAWRVLGDVAARDNRLDGDRDGGDAVAQALTVALYTDPLVALGWRHPAGRVRLYVAYRRELYGARASVIAGVPSVADAHVLFVRLALLVGRPYWSWR